MFRSVSDAITTIDGQVKVHRGLLCKVSEKMRHLVEQMEESEVQVESQGYGSAIKDLHGRLSILDDRHEPATERGLVIWSNLLYGQSMSVSSIDWAKEKHNGIIELLALRQVHKIALKYDHFDAEDASIDAIRDLLYHGIQTYFMPFAEVVIPTAANIPIITKIFMDFVVYGKHAHGFGYADFVDDCTGVPEISPATSAWLSTLAEEQKARVRQDLLRLSNEMLKMFTQKGKDERAGIPAPDLMARCRYHSHAEKGQSCYLDE